MGFTVSGLSVDLSCILITSKGQNRSLVFHLYVVLPKIISRFSRRDSPSVVVTKVCPPAYMAGRQVRWYSGREALLPKRNRNTSTLVFTPFRFSPNLHASSGSLQAYITHHLLIVQPIRYLSKSRVLAIHGTASHSMLRLLAVLFRHITEEVIAPPT